jgi:gliding motility-associated-like protein
MKNRFLLCVLLFLGHAIVSGQEFTNKGKDFWLCFPTHVPSNAIAKMSLFLTSDQNSSGTITVGTFSTTFTVTANQVTTGIDIPYNVAHIAYTEAGTPIKNKGIHVVVDNGKPSVVLYAHIYASARSEASLILPTEVLGKKYFSVNYVQNSGTGNFPVGSSQPFRSQFNVLAVEANTTVRYQLRKNGVLDNTSTTVTLQDIGDILEIQNSADLTGSIIESVSSGGGESCKKIAVFSGSSAVNIGNGTQQGSSTDPLFQQCYPVNTWGKSFGIVPFVTASSPFQYRVMASEDNTKVLIDGVQVVLNAGEFYPNTIPQQQIAITKPFIITADKPICAAQYMISSNLNGYPQVAGQAQGDPEMVILNPIEQNISDISVFSSTQEVIRAQFLNVFTKFANVGSFQINGAAPRGAFVRLPAPYDEYAYLIENLTNYGTTSFRLTATEGFNGICYGTGQVESYGYSAGTSLHDFTPSTTFQNPYSRIDSAITCINTPVKFSVPLSSVPASIQWDFSAAPNISPNTTIGPITTVVADSTPTINGQTVYYYSPGKTFTFAAANTAAVRDTIKLYTTSNTPGGCGGTSQTYTIPVTVRDLPEAKFVTATAGCVSDPVLFTDQSTAKQGSLKLWFWDFGDGTITTIDSATVVPKTYTTPGNYTIKLKVASDIGCASPEFSQTIQKTPKPVANFTSSTIKCANTDVVFTDASTTPSGTIAKWIWDLGDGNPVITNTTNAPVTTKYTSDGAKTVSLKVESTTGCQSDLFTPPFAINPQPQVNFGVPEVCLNDAFAFFSDSTKISDGTEAQFKYLWNFNAGTPPVTPGPLITTSTLKNPQITYRKSDNYKVSLTVTSNNSCVATNTLDFTVNGSTPKASFEFANAAPYCGIKPVKVKNTSTVDFGNVTKLEIYWDFANAPTVKETIDVPVPDGIYPHSYPDPAAPKQYTIKLVAYSGGTSCADFTTKTLTVYPQPKAAFNVSLSELCFGQTVQFTDKGNGISSAAVSWAWDLAGGDKSTLQNPQKQFNDSGLFKVSMYFYNADGCISDTASKQLTVYPNPKLLLTHKKTVLIGATVTLIPEMVYGNELQYLWTPSTYLNNDTAAKPVSTPTDDITYKLTLTAKGGCTVSDTMFIKVLKGPEVPNVFSPNGDGINDTWRIKYLEGYPGAIIEVYNRSGQIVYRSIGYDVDWNGTYDGKPLPVATYYYIINPKNGRQIITGSVTLIK